MDITYLSFSGLEAEQQEEEEGVEEACALLGTSHGLVLSKISSSRSNPPPASVQSNPEGLELQCSTQAGPRGPQLVCELVPEEESDDERRRRSRRRRDPVEERGRFVFFREDVETALSIDLNVTESGEGGRLFCGIYSTARSHATNVKAIKETWGRRCTFFLVFSTGTVV